MTILHKLLSQLLVSSSVSIQREQVEDAWAFLATPGSSAMEFYNPLRDAVTSPLRWKSRQWAHLSVGGVTYGVGDTKQLALKNTACSLRAPSHYINLVRCVVCQMLSSLWKLQGLISGCCDATCLN